MLHLVSIFAFSDHRSILRINTSADLNTLFFGYKVVCLLLRQAYITLPYVKVLTTREFISYTFTRAL